MYTSLMDHVSLLESIVPDCHKLPIPLRPIHRLGKSGNPVSIFGPVIMSETELWSLVRCARCGSFMAGTSAKGGKYHYYTCGRYYCGGKQACTGVRVR